MENIQNLVDRAFGFSGFRIKWEGTTRGRAEKGSTGSSLVLGALSTHHVVDFEIRPAGEGATLRLVKSGSGMAGGLLGMRKANKQFEQVSDTLASWFKEQGLLLNVKKE